MVQAPPLLLSSDTFDPFQAAIIVIALLAGFVKWLWESWQQKREQAKLAAPPDPEQQRLREAAWRKQTGQDSPPPIPTAPPPVAPSPWDELRKAWKELQETARQAQQPADPIRPAKPASRPPQVPQQRQQPARTPASAAPSSPVVAAVAVPAPAAQEAYYPQQQTTSASVLATLHNLRRDPALMRQAILMQAVLGPPKALQTSGDLAI